MSAFEDDCKCSMPNEILGIVLVVPYFLGHFNYLSCGLIVVSLKELGKYPMPSPELKASLKFLNQGKVYVQYTQ